MRALTVLSAEEIGAHVILTDLSRTARQKVSMKTESNCRKGTHAQLTSRPPLYNVELSTELCFRRTRSLYQTNSTDSPKFSLLRFGQQTVSIERICVQERIGVFRACIGNMDLIPLLALDPFLSQQHAWRTERFSTPFLQAVCALL